MDLFIIQVSHHPNWLYMKFKPGDIITTPDGEFIRYITKCDDQKYWHFYLLGFHGGFEFKWDYSFLDNENLIYTDFFRCDDEV